MEKTGRNNLNTENYWNSVYGSAESREKYIKESNSCAGNFNITTGRFYRALDEVNDGDKVLDIGCGAGVFTNLVYGARPQCEVWGTDISSKAMRDNTLENPNIKYLHQEVGKQDLLPDGYFDFVFSGETLEHLEVPESLFKDASRVLRVGGKLVVTTPLGRAVESVEHLWRFDHADVKKLYTDNGFERVRFVYLPEREHILVIFGIGYKI